jgi:hypothetical protein
VACGERVGRQDRYCVYCQHRLSSASQWFGALAVAGVAICAGGALVLFHFGWGVPLAVVVGGFVLALWVFSSRR